jgi:hypothetical protein
MNDIATLVDEIAALDLEQRQDLALRLRTVAETCLEVSDGQQIARVLGVLAHFLDRSPPQTLSEPPFGKRTYSELSADALRRFPFPQGR